MSLRTKLTVGLGFLFLIIFALAFYGSYAIQQLSKDADRILKDNYDSLVYCRNMLLALDDMRTSLENQALSPSATGPNHDDSLPFQAGKSKFEVSLAAERNNITEAHERDYVEELVQDFDQFVSLASTISGAANARSLYGDMLLPAYLSTRQVIADINDLNMAAVERKNMSTKHDAGAMISSMAIIGAVCILLGFFYFWYFPFYVSNSLSYLANRMDELVRQSGLDPLPQSKDESVAMLQSINLLQTRLRESQSGQKK